MDAFEYENQLNEQEWAQQESCHATAKQFGRRTLVKMEQSPALRVRSGKPHRIGGRNPLTSPKGNGG